MTQKVLKLKSRLATFESTAEEVFKNIGNGARRDELKPLFRSGPAFCPQCLAQKLYWPIDWEFNLNQACHVHKIMLIDTCHFCDRKISWANQDIRKCKCGALLSDMPSKAADDIRIFIAAMLHGTMENTYQDSPPWIRDFSAADVLELLDIAGRVLIREQRLTKLDSKSCHSAADVYLNNVYSATGFIELILIRMAQRKQLTDDGLLTGRLWSFLERNKDREFIKGLELFLSGNDFRLQISLHRHIFQKEWNHLTTSKLWKNIGFTRSQVYDLLRHLFQQRRFTYFGGGAGDYLRRLSNKTESLVIQNKVHGKNILFEELVSPGGDFSERHLNLIDDILVGKITVKSRVKESAGIFSWLLPSQEIKSYGHHIIFRCNQLGITSVANVLEIDQKTLHLWMKAQAMTYEFQVGHRRKSISIEQLRQFQKNYITLFSISRCLNVTADEVLATLRSNGIAPAVNSPNLHPRSTLYRIDSSLAAAITASFRKLLPIGSPWAEWVYIDTAIH